MAILINAPNNAGLVLHLPFEENGGNVARDHSGNGKNIALFNSPQWINGVLGKAILLNGSNQYAQGADSGLPLGNSPRSFSMWFNPYSLPSTSTLATLIGWGTNSENSGFGLGIINISDALYFRYFGWGNDTDVAFGFTTNKWYHVCGTFDGTNAILYLNGNSISNVNKSGWNTVSGVFRLGMLIDSGTSLFNGAIDDVRIYNRAISQQEIATLYNSSATKIIAPNAQGLVGAWDFEECSGVTVRDSSGLGNHGNLIGSPTFVDGINGKALSFNGSNQCARIPYTSTLAPTEQISFGCWIFKTNWQSSTDERILSKTESGGYQIGVNEPNIYPNLFGILVRRNSGYSIVTCSKSILLNGWNMVYGTYDGRFTKLFINGVMVNSDDAGGNFPIQYSLNNPLYIGAEPVSDFSPAQFFNGLIDSVRIYNRALSQSEISTLYQSGSTKLKAQDDSGIVAKYNFNEGTGNTLFDSSGNNLHGNLVNSPSWVDGKFGKALSFNGSSNYVITESLNIESVTVAVWIKTSNIDNDTKQISCRDLVSGFNRVWQFRMTTTKLLQFIVFNQSGSNSNTTGTTVLNDNKWHFVVGTYNQNTISVYVDGVFNNSTNALSGPMQINSPNLIGKAGNNTNYWDGLISNVRIYSKALSAQEVTNLYNSY